MKVNNMPSNATPAGAAHTKDVSKTGRGAARTRVSPFDTGKAATDLDSAKVDMSKEALAMQKAKAIAGKDVNNDAKVARLQKLIDAGEYKVDSEAVADKLVNEHLLMGD